MTTEAPPSQQSLAAPRHAWQRRLNEKLGLDKMPVIRRLVYSVLGATVLLIGIAMIVLPGPAVIVIPIGLAILASEYAWARRIIRRGKVFVGRRVQKRQRKKS